MCERERIIKKILILSYSASQFWLWYLARSFGQAQASPMLVTTHKHYKDHEQNRS